MALPHPNRLPLETPDGPLHGYKLAHPMVSADGRKAAFGGIWSSIQAVYGVEGTATCFWNSRHCAPRRRCTCGFYCLHTLDSALAMACDGQYRSTLILEVAVTGRFVRYEDGFRYSGQRVLSARTHRCLCGNPAVLLVDSGSGITGWRRLRPCCSRCRTHKDALTLAGFGALLGDPALITVGDAATMVRPEAEPPDEQDPGTIISVLSAEVALLQARVDSLQAQLSRLSR